MKPFLPILTITGSDTTGGAGIQADIQTIAAMGGNAASVITAITSQNSQGIADIHDLPVTVVKAQLDAIYSDILPRAVKVGMVRDAEAIRLLRQEIVGCRHIVSDPGLLTSRGMRLMGEEALRAYVQHLLPIVNVLVLKCSEAELLLRDEGLGIRESVGIRDEGLGMSESIETQQQMHVAARRLIAQGPDAVLLRGGRGADGMVTGMLLLANDLEHPQFFSSPNTEGWQLHGVGGTLSSAIATRLAMGDDIPTALSNAHRFIRSRVVYSVASTSHSIRQVEIYNRLMELVAQHHRTSRDVAFYASRLNVTSRYLAEVTSRIVGKSPKQLIAEYVMAEVERCLTQTSLSVQEVAQQFGFTSQAAFAKFFHAQKGCSPTDFRS